MTEPLKLLPPPADVLPQTRRVVSTEGLEDFGPYFASLFDFPAELGDEILRSYFEEIIEELKDNDIAGTSFGDIFIDKDKIKFHYRKMQTWKNTSDPK